MKPRVHLATFVLALVASSAAAQPTSPREAAATAAYEAGDLDTALREFEAAHAETQRADLLYVIGRLHAERKECAKAIDSFQRYLATGPGQTQADAAQVEIAKCKATLDAQRPPAGDGTGGGDATTSGTTTGSAGDGASAAIGATPPAGTARAGEGSRSFTSDKLGMTLLVGGVVAGGAAVMLYVQARGAQCGDPVCTELTYDEYLDAEDRAKTLRLTSLVVAGAGAALLGGGLYRFATRDTGRREPSVSLVPTRDGATLTLRGRF